MVGLKIYAFSLFVTVFGSTWATYRESGSVWPKPQAQVSDVTFAVLTDDVTVTTNLVGCSVLDQAIKRYRGIISQDGCVPVGQGYVNYRKHPVKRDAKLPIHPKRVDLHDYITSVNIVVKSACEILPVAGSDEQYSLQVHTPTNQGTVNIVANTVWGAIRAMETFSQLVRLDGNGQNWQLVVNTTSILDFPRFTIRGLMLDTSRHYIPVSVILENLEAMAQNKLNVFHWHIVDDQSFPYQSAKFPEMSLQGAYDPVTHIYSQKDVAKVINFARVRGIRVIPEFDSPGHTQSWGKGIANLLTPCYNGGRTDGTFGPIDPILDSTYAFLKDFLGEIANVFPDNYLHLGGDEVDFSCWKTNPDILDFMKAQGFGTDFSKLEQFYIQKVVNLVNKDLKKSTLVWQEVFDNGVQLDKNTVVHVWKDGYQAELANVTAAGYTTMLSACWYLNDITYGVDWQKYYACDPWDFTGSDAQKNLVVGGAAAMWSEYVDGVGITPRTWARASVVAERLWSAVHVKDANQAVPRLLEQRCRMLKRGIRVDPINGPGYCPCDAYV